MNIADSALAELQAPFADAELVHLNNAGVAPLSRRAEQALLSVSEGMRDGTLGIGRLLKRYEMARGTFADLVGCKSEQLAFFQTCAAAISQVAFGFPLKTGDRILRLDQEYPSNAYPWHRAAERVGAVVDVFASRADFTWDLEGFVAAITPATKVVAISWVQFQTGAVADLRRIAGAAHKVGAIVVTDAIQGLGILPFDMGMLGVDAVCGGTHKWLMGPVGHGFLAVTDDLRERLVPIMQGAITYGTPDDPVDVMKAIRSDIRRFEPGTPMLMGAISGAASVELLNSIGIRKVNEAAVAVSAVVEEKARSKGFALLPRTDSPIVTMIPKQDPRALANRLADAGIAVGVRAGGLRIAPHAFNSSVDVDRLFDAIG